MVAVRCKDAVIAREVDPRARDQGGQLGDEIQGLEDDVGGAVAVGSFSRCRMPWAVSDKWAAYSG